MSLKFVYVTSNGIPVNSISEVYRILHPTSMSNLPPEMLSLIIENLQGWGRFNFGLTCHSAYSLCFSDKFHPKGFLASLAFTEAIKGASRSKIVAKRLKCLLGIRPMPMVDNHSLMQHQVKAITFMRKREKESHCGIRGGILQMKMGLGKSLVAIAHSLTSIRPACREIAGGKGFPTLIVASKTVMKEWKTEERKFFEKKLKVLYLHTDYLSNKEYKTITRWDIVKYDLVVTTYDVVRQTGEVRGFIEDVKERGSANSLQNGKVIAIHCRSRKESDVSKTMGPGIIFSTPWERVIVDESHAFANPKTQLFAAVMAIYGRYKWCLTGTPITNRNSDLWSQLRFCGYRKVMNVRDWQHHGQEYMVKHELGKVILQMDHKDAKIRLPAKDETSIVVNLDNIEKQVYDYAHKAGVKMFKGMLESRFRYSHVLGLFMRLRQCCIAPYLVLDESKRKYNGSSSKFHLKEVYKGEYAKWISNKDGEAGIRSKKMTAIIETLKLVPKDEKVLVFSSFTSALDLLKYGCSKLLPDLKIVQIDGSTKGPEREVILNDFRNKPDIRALFMSYKIGAEGLNLTQANHVICIEPWWNKALYNQAVSRTWRYGQKKKVKVYTPLVANSIEGQMIDMCKKKEDMTNDFLSNTFEPSCLDIRTMGRILGVYN